MEHKRSTCVGTLHKSSNSIMMTPVLSLPCVQCIMHGKELSFSRIFRAIAILDLPCNQKEYMFTFLCAVHLMQTGIDSKVKISCCSTAVLMSCDT